MSKIKYKVRGRGGKPTHPDDAWLMGLFEDADDSFSKLLKRMSKGLTYTARDMVDGDYPVSVVNNIVNFAELLDELSKSKEVRKVSNAYATEYGPPF